MIAVVQIHINRKATFFRLLLLFEIENNYYETNAL